MDKPIKKAINFDLKTKSLKKYYCKTNNPFEYLKAYKEIQNFMEKNGFSHRQWSGYISNRSVDKSEIVLMAKRMTEKFPWLADCVNHFDVTDIGKQYDLTDVIKGYSKEIKSERNKPTVLSDDNHPIEKEKQAVSSQEKDLSETVSKDKYEALCKKYDDLSKEYSALLEAAIKKQQTIDNINLTLNEHPQLKEELRKAKTETLQGMEKRGKTLNNKKSEKISSSKATKHKNELRL